MRIAIFDYRIVPNNPAGSCHLRLLDALSKEHEFTVFASQFVNPCPERIRWVRVPAPSRPLAALFVVFHALAPLRYWWHRLRKRAGFDLIQAVESNLMIAGLVYSHFCHRHFLNRYWKGLRSRGLRGRLRALDHRLHAWLEPRVYRRAAHVVVPSQGLARELVQEYPFLRGKTHVIPNPVDAGRMRRPPDFDREPIRQRLGISPGELSLAFVALGHFERKGLPVALEAMAELHGRDLRLVVVGGEKHLVEEYRKRVARMGLENHVTFTGSQPDVRPYLWSADAFLLPSVYETFSLVTFEAAAAALPLIVTRLHGVEELLRDGENGFLIEPRAASVARKLEQLLALPAERRMAMGHAAQRDAARFSPEAFLSGWRSVYGGCRVE